VSQARLIVFTDLDGCLLDARDYSFDAARPALDALRAAGIPLVLCSSKTRAEMEPLARRLGLATPLIVESGGAVVVPEGDEGGGESRLLFPLGVPRRALLSALPELAREAGVAVRAFSEMSAAEIAGLTGLGPDDAARALEREFDEPFVVLGTGGRDLALDARLDAAARRHGLRVRHGGRLHHLSGPADKGHGVRAVLRLHADAPHASVGLGDAATDLPLLSAVDRPILVPGERGIDPALATELPEAEVAPAPGPAGWNAAVLAVLSGDTLPRAAA
jgi:mannosyl-3-phosphoglycerate phosphatase